MKKAIAAVLMAALCAVYAGCGGGEAEIDPRALFAGVAEAMSEVSGYRIRGSNTMKETGTGAVTGTLRVEISGEVQVVEGVTHQHLVAVSEGQETEAYIIGDGYYEHMPGSGWRRSPGRGLGTSALDTRQIEIVAEKAESTEVIQNDGRLIGLEVILGEDYFKAALDAYIQELEAEGQAVPEDWRAGVEASLGQIGAVVRLWVFKDTKLINAMEMDYIVGGEAAGGTLSSEAHFDLFDYNAQGIVVELPEEAKNAEEVNLLSP